MRMKHDPVRSGKRAALNVSVDSGIVQHARTLGINMSQVVEAALRDASREAEARKWRQDNAEWIAAHNRWIEGNGIPLDGLPPL